MRTALLVLLFSLGSATAAHADAIPGDDECGPGQHWEGAHDGECSCAIGTPAGNGVGGLGGVLGGLGLIGLRRRAR